MCQIWCESVQKWRRYGRLTDFKMAPAAILDFCIMLILMVNLSALPYFQPIFQIRCKCVQKWPSYGQKYDFQHAAAPYWILLDTSSEGKICIGTLFSASVSNLVQIGS